MGSFSVKCVVTGQVIKPGSKCRIAFIKPRMGRNRLLTRGTGKTPVESLHHENCNFDAFYSLMTSFMPATYDDFGTFQLSLTPMTSASLMSVYETLAKHGFSAEGMHERLETFSFESLLSKHAPKLSALFKTEQHPFARFHGYELDGTEALALFSELQEAIRNDLVFFSVATLNWRQLKLTVIHEETYQAMVTSRESQPNQSRRQYMTDTLAFITKELAESSSESDSSVDGEILAGQLLHQALTKNLPSEIIYPMMHTIRHRMFAIRKTIVSGQATYQTLCDDLHDALDELYAMCTLYRLDVQLMPVVTCRLDSGNVAGQAYASFVSEVSARISNF